MMLWSVVTAHRIAAITLQFMRELYDDQQRPLISNTKVKV